MATAEPSPANPTPAVLDDSGSEVETKAGELVRVKGVAAVKPADDFRVYQDTDPGVIEHYRQMRLHQCVDFVTKMGAKWHTFDKAELTIREAFEKLEGYVDASDPDITLPNVLHAFQTAEAARAANKPDWFVFTAFIHDMGKIMYNWGRGEDGQEGTLTGPQWALGGDTWVVGVPIPDDVVLPEFNKLNPDAGKYEGPCGMYKPGCGLKNLKFAYGHDEYMYQVLRHNDAQLPEEAFAIVRYHSCYPWHREGNYSELEGPGDAELKKVVQDFNRFDLYTKCEEVPDAEALWPYYQSLIDKFTPGKLRW